MKAFVFTEKGKIEQRELPEPQLCGQTEAGRRAAILRPRFLSPCSSDVHTVYAGAGPRRSDLVLGHEGLAEVVAVGSAVQDFHPGELAAVSAVMPDAADGTGHEGDPFTGTKLGRNINGMWAEYFLVPDADQNLAHLPADISMEAALMCTDMLPTGFTAAEGAFISPGQTAVVLGTGAVGLMAVSAARILGASHIIAVGSARRPLCTKLAMDFGAELVLSYQDGRVLAMRDGTTSEKPGGSNEAAEALCGSRAEGSVSSSAPGTGSLQYDKAQQEAAHAARSPLANAAKNPAVDRILDLTVNAGADAVLICGGGKRSLLEASDLVRYGTGIAVNVEYIEGQGTVELPIFSLGRGMAGKTFRFLLSRGGRSFTERMLQYAAKGDAAPERLVTHHLKGFDKIPEALELMREKPGDLIKVMLEI